MEMANSIILNLHVIGATRAGDKIFTSTPEFTIQVQGPFSSLTRRYYGECRTKNLQDILGCVNAASRHLEEYSMDRARLVKALLDSIQGLNSLQETYAEDPRSVGQICIIRDTINTIVTKHGEGNSVP